MKVRTPAQSCSLTQHQHCCLSMPGQGAGAEGRRRELGLPPRPGMLPLAQPCPGLVSSLLWAVRSWNGSSFPRQQQQRGSFGISLPSAFLCQQSSARAPRLRHQPRCLASGSEGRTKETALLLPRVLLPFQGAQGGTQSFESVLCS